MTAIECDVTDHAMLLSLLGDNRFGVIVADPPWPYDNDQSGDPARGGYTYPPMSIPDIMALPVAGLAAPNCALYLWGTWPKLPHVVATMAAWGFEHKTGFPWVKTTKDRDNPRYGPGYWVGGCSEYVLIGTRGHVSPPPPPRYLGLLGPALAHSRKPDSIHDMVAGHQDQGLGLKGPYLELFGRRNLPGWTVVGNMVERTLL